METLAGSQTRFVKLPGKTKGRRVVVEMAGERVIGSIRRECLDHVVVIGEWHLREILSKYVAYYNRKRTHLSLAKDAPKPRTVQLPSQGRVVKVPRVRPMHLQRSRPTPLETRP